MTRQPSLQELSLALPSRERMVLLDKVKKSLSIQKEAKEPSVFHKIDDSDQRSVLLQRELLSMSLFDKIRLWFKKLFSPRTQEELIVDFVMAKLYNKIGQGNVALVEADGEVLTPYFGEKLLEFYTSLRSGLLLISYYWNSPGSLENAVILCLTKRVPNSKENFFSFITFEEAINLYGEKDSKSYLKSTVLERLESYIRSIPDEILKEIEAGLWPIYWLRELSSFDFGKLFSGFRVSIDSIDRPSQGSFKPASMKQLLPMLDSLAFAVFSASKVGKRVGIHEELYRYFLFAQTQELHIHSADENKTSSTTITLDDLAVIPLQAVNEISVDLEKIAQGLADFGNQVPLADVLKIGHRDPFFRFLAYSPAPKFKDFYRNFLQLRVLQDLDRDFPLIRQALVQRYKEILFVNGTINLQYFIAEIVQIKNPGFPTFAYLEPMNTMYSFLKLVFVPLFSEVLRSTSKIIPERLRDVHNAFLFQTGSLEDVLIQIEKIDEFYNPVSQDGRVFFRTRAAAIRDLGQQKAYRGLMIQRDKDIKIVLDKGIDSVNGLLEAIDTVLSTTIESIKVEIARHVDLQTGKPTKELLKIIRKRLEILRKTIILEESAGEETSNQSLMREPDPY
ncbi:MAG: hypothetical protein GW949_00640 [Spirochaetales bacterium]|nr:hypothetical protein [Spirochaetales bacterium]